MNLKINNTTVDISRINVAGGLNSTGKSTVSRLLYAHLKSLKDDESLEYLLSSEGVSQFDSGFDNEGYVPSEVFYLSSISLLDLKNLDFLKIDHIAHLKDALDGEGHYNCEVLSKIRDIITEDCLSTGSAGIKEFGVLQILLENRCLCENSFLIIDEPENNLHPGWQIKFAEILVMLSRDLNIRLYINSHSPIFIEAMSLYAQYYGLIGETCFYLSKEGLGFKRISPDNMAAVYENLTSPLDKLDDLKTRILFME